MRSCPTYFWFENRETSHEPVKIWIQILIIVAVFYTFWGIFLFCWWCRVCPAVDYSVQHSFENCSNIYLDEQCEWWICRPPRSSFDSSNPHPPHIITSFNAFFLFSFFFAVSFRLLALSTLLLRIRQTNGDVYRKVKAAWRVNITPHEICLGCLAAQSSGLWDLFRWYIGCSRGSILDVERS
jgi:hypothetical protein